MRPYIRLVFFIIVLISIPSLTNAMWAKLSDTELIEQSDVITTAELIAETHVTINQSETIVAILKVEETLKGDKNQSAFLLAVPSNKGLHKSDDIFYKVGQKGLWFLRERKIKGEAGIYLADQPQRFVPEKHAVAQVEIVKNILKEKKNSR